MSNEDRGIVYDNIGLLDIRNADEATLREIKRIGNVGLVLHTAQNAAFVNILSIDNVGFTLAASAHCKVEMGPVRLDAEALKNQSEPLDMVIMGPVTVAGDVSPSDIERGVERLNVMGPVICPDNVATALRNKIERLMGLVQSYPAGATLVTIAETLRLDHATLAAMADGTALVVHGRLLISEVLREDLLQRKLQWLAVHGSVLCPEENAPLLRSLMPDTMGKFTLLPPEFRVIERALTIDPTFLRFSPARKWHCIERVIVDPAVTTADLDRHLDRLRCTDTILAPAALRDALAPKCDLTADRVLFYEGALWLEEGDSELTADRFAYLEGVATLVVDDTLEIHEDVSPAVLAELAQVHNFGTIRCNPAQMSALRARMGRNEGELVDNSTVEEERDREDEDEPRRVGNVGYLTL